MPATMAKIAVTGATGFVGNALVVKLVSLPRFEVLAWVRKTPVHVLSGLQYVQQGDLSPDAN